MRLTKFGHACVRIESGSRAVVVDPGSFTEPDAVDGATAVLITHEHADHFHLDHLRATDAPVFTISAVAEQIAADAPDVAERVTVVAPGQSFDAGHPVTAVGRWHKLIHEEGPRFANSGYLVDVDGLTVYHPGDAFALPAREVDVLLLPVSGPWLRLGEAIDFARAVGAPRNVAIHELVSSEIGLGITDARLRDFLGARDQDYVRTSSGSDVPL
jgi:L-ascorbate metabolism protein UlaG (beta-lactamase superfamily)